ncbi:mitochondrial import inner membrane translocase subunit Tim10 isoform X1 [Hypanus sabinus]|uniref:mitochondrial import inner membrane translocase subunit Tim10 isoform X1 n=1 Tax=Hypanus sabinus TaxID=79690 RepID=UPI0028C4505C|nr:mitochondrial import inner membrane translocase subunit Tim10 isoform X1 [Hypanus sabinus]
MDPMKAQQLAAELEVEMMADMYNSVCTFPGVCSDQCIEPVGITHVDTTSAEQHHRKDCTADNRQVERVKERPAHSRGSQSPREVEATPALRVGTSPEPALQDDAGLPPQVRAPPLQGARAVEG